MDKNIVIFDKNTLDFVLDAINLTVDDDGFILNDMVHIKTKDGEKIHKDELAFISKDGFYKKDLNSLINVVKHVLNR